MGMVRDGGDDGVDAGDAAVSDLAAVGGLAPGELPKSIATSGISGGPGLMGLFSSHPPMEQRIARLQQSAG